MSELTKWLVGGGFAFIGGLMVALLRIAYKLGADAKEIRTGLERIAKIETHIEQIPTLVVRMGTVEGAYASVRSDIKDLMRAARGSRPEWNGEE